MWKYFLHVRRCMCERVCRSRKQLPYRTTATAIITVRHISHSEQRKREIVQRSQCTSRGIGTLANALNLLFSKTRSIEWNERKSWRKKKSARAHHPSLCLIRAYMQNAGTIRDLFAISSLLAEIYLSFENAVCAFGGWFLYVCVCSFMNVEHVEQRGSDVAPIHLCPTRIAIIECWW